MAGPSLPVVLDGFGWSRGLLSGPPEGLVCPAAGVPPPTLPCCSWAALRASFPGGLEGGFLPILPGVFRSGGGRGRPRAR